MSNLKEIKREPRNKDVIEMLEAAIQRVRESGDDATEAVVMMKIGDSWRRMTTGVDDLVQLVGAIELLKYDSLQRMQEVE
jgi:hypothetical protein